MFRRINYDMDRRIIVSRDKFSQLAVRLWIYFLLTCMGSG